MEFYPLRSHGTCLLATVSYGFPCMEVLRFLAGQFHCGVSSTRSSQILLFLACEQLSVSRGQARRSRSLSYLFEFGCFFSTSTLHVLPRRSQFCPRRTPGCAISMCASSTCNFKGPASRSVHAEFLHHVVLRHRHTSSVWITACFFSPLDHSSALWVPSAINSVKNGATFFVSRCFSPSGRSSCNSSVPFRPPSSS